MKVGQVFEYDGKKLIVAPEFNPLDNCERCFTAQDCCFIGLMKSNKKKYDCFGTSRDDGRNVIFVEITE